MTDNFILEQRGTDTEIDSVIPRNRLAAAINALPVRSPEANAVARFLDESVPTCSTNEAKFVIDFLHTFKDFSLYLDDSHLKPNPCLKPTILEVFTTLIGYSVHDYHLMSRTITPPANVRLTRGGSGHIR